MRRLAVRLAKTQKEQPSSQIAAPAVTGPPLLVMQLASAAVGGAATAVLLMQSPPLWLATLALLVLTWWLPGILLIALWRLPELDQLTGLLLAPAAGWAWLVAVGLLLHWLPGQVTRPLLGVVYAGGAGVLLLALHWRPPYRPTAVPFTRWLLVGILLILLAALWLPTLGGREFFHDESTVLVRARDAIRGVADAPARHTKGPGEIVVAMVFYRALGTIDEFYARLPFGLAGLGAVLLTVPLGWRLFSWPAGIWAAILMGINGYVLALSRMTQYQGPLLLLIAGAALAAWLVAQLRSERALPWFLLLTALAAAGFIMHYEFVLLVPMLLAMLVIGRLYAWPDLRRMAPVAFVVACGGLVLLVYGQMLTNDYFTKSTQFYYSARFQTDSANNVLEFLQLSTLYNSIYFFGGLVLLVVGGLWLAWRQNWPAALLLTLWFTPALLLYLFLIESPGTHYYAIMGSWSLLAALPLVTLWQREGRTPVKRVAGAALVTVWLLVSVVYLNRALLRTEPLYLLNLNETQHPLYPASYDAAFAAIPRVGLPIDEGWRTLGVLREWHALEGTYSSNERRTRWYLGDFDRVNVDEEPDYFFVARHVQDLDRGYRPDLLDGYTPVGEVRVNDEPRITLYRRGATDGTYATYDAAHFARSFRAHVVTLGDEPEPMPLVSEIAISPALTLASSGVEEQTIGRGSELVLVNNWQVHAPLGQNLKLFVHLGADAQGAPLAQWDGYPRLNGARTTDWQAGQIVEEYVLLPIPAAMSAGVHPLYLGFYDATTGERYGVGRVEVGQVTVR